MPENCHYATVLSIIMILVKTTVPDAVNFVLIALLTYRVLLASEINLYQRRNVFFQIVDVPPDFLIIIR